MKIKIRLKNESETRRLGEFIGELLKGGEVITLIGDLGAGKTTLTQSIAKSIGIEDDITSPTFTIVNEYEEGIGLNHFDVYRIGGSDEMFDIGFDEYLESGRVNIIEWANIIEDILPEERLEISLVYEIDGRTANISSKGSKYDDILKAIEGEFKIA